MVNTWDSVLSQDLLIKAAFNSDSSAIAAWREWKVSHKLEDLESESHQILPQLYLNLKNLGVQDDYSNKLKGIYRFWWSKNTRLIKNVVPFFEKLKNSGVEFLLLDSTAVVLGSPKELGNRPLESVSILVQPVQAWRSIAALRGEGCHAVTGLPYLFKDAYLRMFPNLFLKTPDGDWIEVCWDLVGKTRHDLDDFDYFQTAQPVSIFNHRLLLINPAYLLMRISVKINLQQIQASITNLVDALHILKRYGQEFDWEGLAGFAYQMERTHELSEFLKDPRISQNVQIPQHLVHILKLQEKRPLQQKPTSTISKSHLFYKRCIELWRDYQLTGVTGIPKFRLVGFPDYLMRHWGLSHFWQLPGRAVRSARWWLKK